MPELDSSIPLESAVFFTPCLVIAATLATGLSQLGFSFGGFTATIALFIAFDFILFRYIVLNTAIEEVKLAVFYLGNGSMFEEETYHT